MSVVLNGHYSFANVDRSFDAIIALGMQPVVELSFMPGELASGTRTIFHYGGRVDPPRDFRQWGALISALGAHLVARYGIDEVRTWYFEVWNEPNLDFWTGTQAQYFELYRQAAVALKAVDARVRVGGPATAQTAWLADLLNFTRTHGVPLDFVSTHLYPTDPQVPRTGDGFVRLLQQTRAIVGPGMPLLFTEFNSGLIGMHDLPYASAMLVQTAALMAPEPPVDLLSYWTFDDTFEENGFQSAPFHAVRCAAAACHADAMAPLTTVAAPR